MIHNIYKQEYTAAQYEYLRETYKVIDETADRIAVDIDDDSYEVINAIFRARWMSNEEFEQYMHVTLPDVEDRVHPLAWEEVNTLYKGLEKYTRNRIIKGCRQWIRICKSGMYAYFPRR
jgi:hypothetical protein